MNYLHLVRNITAGIKSTGKLKRENKATSGFKQKSCILGVMSCKRAYCLLQTEKSYLQKNPCALQCVLLPGGKSTPFIPRSKSRHRYTKGVRTSQHYTMQQALLPDTTVIATQLQSPVPQPPAHWLDPLLCLHQQNRALKKRPYHKQIQLFPIKYGTEKVKHVQGCLLRWQDQMRALSSS